jgi:hypothetical protein
MSLVRVRQPLALQARWGGDGVNAEQWNALYPVGTPVLAYPGARPEDFPNDRRLVTRTRSRASVLGGHTDVVWVDGHSACIALTHIDVITEAEFQAAQPITDVETAVRELGALPMPMGNPPMDAERLAEIVARVSAATDGPWRNDVYGVLGPDTVVAEVGGYERVVGSLYFGVGQQAEADEAFALHAREDVPALLAEVQRLKAALAGARTAALNEAADWFEQRAAAEPDQNYRARVMRGAANDIRRLATAEQRHLLHDADPDSTTPAFPDLTKPEEAS